MRAMRQLRTIPFKYLSNLLFHLSFQEFLWITSLFSKSQFCITLRVWCILLFIIDIKLNVDEFSSGENFKCYLFLKAVTLRKVCCHISELKY